MSSHYARKRNQQRGYRARVQAMPEASFVYVVEADLIRFREVYAACLRAHEAVSVDAGLTTQETPAVGTAEASTTRPTAEIEDGCNVKSCI